MTSPKYFRLVTIAAITTATIRVIIFYAHNFLVYAAHCL